MKIYTVTEYYEEKFKDENDLYSYVDTHKAFTTKLKAFIYAEKLFEELCDENNIDENNFENIKKDDFNVYTHIYLQAWDDSILIQVIIEEVELVGEYTISFKENEE